MCGAFGYGGFEVPKYNTFIEDKNGERIDFILDVAKRSRLNMGIRDGTLTVRVPYGCSKQQLESFINNNLGWIKEQKDKAAVGLPKDFCHGERLRLLGNELTLTLVQADKYFSPKIEDGKLLIAVNKTSDQTYVKEQTTKFINDLTVAEITKSMQKMSASTGLVPEKVTIKPLTASWGRCISNRHISINSKLIVFRRECIDYVCLHELCHLVFMDHSKDFWALVGKFCPDWRGIREEMKG